jgi:hypothetical protein
MNRKPPPPRFDPARRRFLRTAAGGAAAVAVGGPALLAGCNDDDASASDPAEPKEAEARSERARVAFFGAHQPGVLLRVSRSVDRGAAAHGRRSAGAA